MARSKAKQTVVVTRSTVRKKASTPVKNTTPKRCPSCGKSMTR